MRIRIRRACRGLVTSVWWVLASCSAPKAVNGDRVRSLDDGVYLVVQREDARVDGNALNEKARVLELESLPRKGEASETILVLDGPLVRFRQMSLQEFRFYDKNE